jgi:hypothetical protein
LTLKKGNQSRIFTSTRDVVVMQAGAPVVHGQWRSAPAPDGGKRLNRLAYTFDGAEADPVAVRWSFNDQNQLVGVVPAAANGGADSAAFAFAGKIKVDDSNDIAYELLDAAGEPSGHDVAVLGALSFDQKDNSLVITFEDGAPPTAVMGDSGLGSLSTGMHSFEDFKGSDVLRFQASTINVMENGDVAVMPAEIQWVGNWDLQASRLVFAAELKTTGSGKPAVNIVLGGKTKAVAGGLAYFAGPDGSPQLALEIGGTHKWDGGAGKWDVSLGFTEKKLTAKLAGGVSVERKTGERFALHGNLAFDKEGDQTSLEMDLEAFYQWGPGGTVRFNAAVSMVNGSLNYNLGLEGQFNYDGMKLTFRIQFTRDGTGDKLSVELAARGDNDFFAKLVLVLNPSDPSKVNLEVKFQVRMKWIDGVPVKEKPAMAT